MENWKNDTSHKIVFLPYHVVSPQNKQHGGCHQEPANHVRALGVVFCRH